MINNKTQLNLVIGNPLDHTKSPILHNLIYRALNCNAVLLAHATNDLPTTMSALKTFSVALTAVTMPYKEAILPYLDCISPEVKELHAANTIIRHNEKLTGYNTDIDGIAYALRNITLPNKNVLIIGAGGASRAAAYYLKKNNATILWLNRTPQHLLPLIEKFGGTIADLKQLDSYPIDIIINTTPLGMFPHINVSPLPNYYFKADQIIFDMVYNPLETLLIQNAKEKNAICISGIDMFIGQGIKQIELWLNKPIMTPDLIDSVKKELCSSLNKPMELI